MVIKITVKQTVVTRRVENINLKYKPKVKLHDRNTFLYNSVGPSPVFRTAQSAL